ncbi:Phytochrome-like protein cph2 [Pandoraea morbifera]|uniref:diguanylate cyclase n=1 Tax=Pandoraea morbifera TaxID=2508300 RepID=A0A5E4S6W5_9BURK|nr:diguanylate cyclase [Pandoraea morbifera]VVD71536.1 Phytochrome-like protein cph2 [Pandoraea morbifera]
MTQRSGVLTRKKWSARLRALSEMIDARPSAVGWAGTGLALGIFVGVGVLLRMDLQTRESLVLERAQGVSSVVAASLGANFAVYDALLKEMVREAEDPATPMFPARVRDRVRFGQALVRDFLDDAYIVDKNGIIVAPLDAAGASPENVADRDYFRSHEINPSLGLYISQPYASRNHRGTVSVALTRRIASPDHSFNGVAVIALRLDHLGALVKDIDSADIRTIDIVEEKGAVLACDPCAGTRLGALVPLPGNATRERNLTEALSFPLGVRAREYRSVRVPGASMYVVVTPSMQAAMHEWRRNAALLGAIAATCAATMIAGAWLLVTAMRARAATVAQRERLSATDGLTGQGNRRAFDAKLADAWRRAQRSGNPLSVLIADIDDFRHFNDTYGHAVADDVLRAVASNIGGHMRRDTDLAARYGSDVMAVVLPETDAAAAVVMAEQFRRDVERLHIAHEGSATGTLTVSVGVATGVPGECGSAEALLKAAEAQCRLAKQAGRNRVSAVVVSRESAGHDGLSGPGPGP